MAVTGTLFAAAGTRLTPRHLGMLAIAGVTSAPVTRRPQVRTGVDGFALRADDTTGASERAPRRLTLLPEILTPGREPHLAIEPGTATLIATGGMVPRGADAVVMVEHTDTIEEAGVVGIEVRRAVPAGQFIAFAGSDMAAGETVLRAGQRLTSREIGMLAAVGRATVEVWRRPLVAIISTGDEIIAPGEPMRSGAVYDFECGHPRRRGRGGGRCALSTRHRRR